MAAEFNPAVLKKLRTDSKLTQQAVYEGTGIHGTDISAHENGKRVPADISVKKYAEFYKVNPKEFYKGKSSRKVTEKITSEEVMEALPTPVVGTTETPKEDSHEEAATSDSYLSVPAYNNDPVTSMFFTVDKFADGTLLVKMEGKFYRAQLTEL